MLHWWVEFRIYNVEKNHFYNKIKNQKIDYYKTYVIDNDGNKQYVVNPIKQIERYRKNLLLYIPRLASAIDDNPKRIASMKIGIYFHKATTKQAEEFIPNHKEKHCLVFGQDLLTPTNLSKIIPDIYMEKSYFMDSHWSDEIRFWLKPPLHSIEQG